MESIVHVKGDIAADGADYLLDNYGFAGPDYGQAGYLVTSVAGPLTLASTGGLISINPTDDGDVNIGTAAYNGDINIGTAGARTLTLGSSNATVNLVADVLTIEGKVVEDATQVSANIATVLTGAQMWQPNLTIVMAPGGAITLTLPTAANMVSNCPRTAVVGDFVTFTVTNNQTNAANTITVTAGANMTTVGDMVITPDNGAHGVSGVFGVRLTTVTGNGAAIIYRLNNSTN